MFKNQLPLSMSQPKYPLKTKLYIQKSAFPKFSNLCVGGIGCGQGMGEREEKDVDANF